MEILQVKKSLLTNTNNLIIPPEYYTLYEGLIYTYNIDTSVNIFNNWKISDKFYAKKKEEISIVLMPVSKKVIISYFDVESSIKLLNTLGYFPTTIYIFQEKFGWYPFNNELVNKLLKLNTHFYIRFNPKYDQEISVKEINNLYHISFKKYEEKIKNIGLIPKNKFKIENHPERIYLIIGKKGLNILIDKLASMYPNDKLIKIKLSGNKLEKYHIRFFSDVTFKNYGIYTLQNINKECIDSIEDIIS